jgi:hypothetical protein
VTRLSVDFVALAAGAFVAISLRRERGTLLRLAFAAALFLLATIVILGACGWPLFRPRVCGLHGPPALDAIHRLLGHLTVVAAAAIAPLFAAAAWQHARWWRKAAHLFASALMLLLTFVAGFSGYILPNGPRPPAASVLRFAVLHMMLIPALLAIVLLITLRASRASESRGA